MLTFLSKSRKPSDYRSAALMNYNNTRKHRIRKRMYKRQKGLCWICGERMAISTSQAQSPMFATFDHLLPKAQGGGNTQDNLKLAHQKCNMMRSDLPVALVLVAQATLCE